MMNHLTKNGAGGWQVFPPMSAPRESAKPKFQPDANMLLAIAITIVVALIFTVAFVNLRTGAKQIRYERTYRVAVTDAQFVRSVSEWPRPNLVRRQV